MKKNLQIQINGTILDIDDETAFGVTFKGFSFNEADKIHLSYSNEFSVPITKNNRKVFGFPDNMNLNSITYNADYYSQRDTKVFVDGQFLFAGKCYVSSVQEKRLNLYIVSSKNFIDKLAKMTLKDITDLMVPVLNAELATYYPSGAQWEDELVPYLAAADKKVWIPYAVGTFYHQYPATKTSGSYPVQTTNVYNKYEEIASSSVESVKSVVTEYKTNDYILGNYKTGHLFVNLKAILDALMTSFGFTATYDARLTTELSKDYVRLPDLVIVLGGDGYYAFGSDSTLKCKIEDSEGKAFSRKIKALDFFKTICQEYAIVFDVTNDNTVSFKCFDDIKSNTVKNYKIKQVTSRKFSLDNVQQKCWIGYSSLQGDGTDAATTGGVMLTCNNQNIDEGSDDTITFSIKRALVGYLNVYFVTSAEETYALDLTEEKLMEEIIIVRPALTHTPIAITVGRRDTTSPSDNGYTLYYGVQSTVSSSGVYDLYKANVLYPEEIEVDAYLKTHEALSFSASNYCTFDSIPGHWYVEEIQGYNPRLSSQLVKMRAMRIR